MIELFQYPPAFNVPSPSPFCVKVELLLKMASIDYSNRYDADVRKAPKAKLPYIVIDGKETIEDHLYWLLVDARWLNDDVWPALRERFFSGLPPWLKLIVPGIVRKQVKRTLYGQGFGRHSPEELDYFAEKDLDALDALLGDKAYMMGERICSVDATVYGILSSIYYPDFDSSLKAIALHHPSLAAYCDRITARFFPDYSREQ